MFDSLVAALCSMLHPFFISMTEINHNSKDKVLEVSVRIFADDFENTLRNNCGCKVELIKPINRIATEKLVAAYLTKRLQISIDAKPVELEFLGIQLEEGSVWSYFESRNVASVRRIDLMNDILYDFSKQQINMLQVKANGKERTDKLEYPASRYSVAF